jgi:hypothetical protein
LLGQVVLLGAVGVHVEELPGLSVTEDQLPFPVTHRLVPLVLPEDRSGLTRPKKNRWIDMFWKAQEDLSMFAPWLEHQHLYQTLLRLGAAGPPRIKIIWWDASGSVMSDRSADKKEQSGSESGTGVHGREMGGVIDWGKFRAGTEWHANERRHREPGGGNLQATDH